MLPRPPETFLGRDSELQRLLSFHSRRRLMFIKGMAGIGKTALALCFLDRLRREHPDLQILCVRCLDGWSIDDLIAEVDGAAPSAEGGERVVSSQLRERILAFVHRLNERRCLVFLDDVHALPEPDLRLFVQILQDYVDGHVLMTSRRELPLSPVEAIDVYQEKLAGLTSDESEQLVQSLLELHGGAPGLEASLLERPVRDAAGHPFMLRLLASLVVTRSLDVAAFSRGTATELRTWLLGCVLGEVGPEERAVLEVVAVARVALPTDTLGDLAGLPDVREALRSLERKFLVDRESADCVRVHQVLAEHVRADMDDARRRQHHASLAGYFHETGQSQEAFHHAMEAGMGEKAAAILAEAAGRLCSRGLYLVLLEDVRRLEQADVPVPPRVRLMQANALSVTGRGNEGLAILEELSRKADDPSVVADSLTSMGGTHINCGHYVKALACYNQALGLCRGEKASPALFKCLNYLGLIHGYRGEMRKAFDFLKRSLSLSAREGEQAARAHATRIQATLHALVESFDEALVLARQGLDLAVALDSVRIASFARYAVALALIGRGEHAAARETLMTVLRDGQRLGDIHVQAYAHLELGQVAWEEGGLDEAGEALATAVTRFREQGDSLGVAMAELRIGKVRLEQGRGEDAAALFERVRAVARERGDPRLEAEAWLALAEQALQEGALETARGRAEEARAILGDLDLPLLSGDAALLLAEAHARRFRWSDARAWVAKANAPRNSSSLRHRASILLCLAPGHGRAERHRLRTAAADAFAALRGTERRRSRRFELRMESTSGPHYRIITVEGERMAGDPEVVALREGADQFAFFLDAPARVFRVEGKGELPLFRRRIVSRLLLALMRSGESGLSTEELVPLVWGTPYQGEASSLEVRKAVSRLRELLEADRARPRIICHFEGASGGFGRYVFRPPVGCCAILEAEEDDGGEA